MSGVALGIGSGAILGALLFSIIVAERLIRQPRELRADALRDFHFPAEKVTFYSPDGIRLAGVFIPGTLKATIILLHGFSRSKEQLLPHASFLHRAGFNILMFDFRGSGESGGSYITFGQKEQRDLQGALRYLKTRPDIDSHRIGVFGFSMGGAVALLGALAVPQIRAVVVDSTFAQMTKVIQKNFRDYLPLVPFFPFGYLALIYIRIRTGVYFPHIRPGRTIAQLGDCPVFIIHGSNDEKIPFSQAQELDRAAGGRAELWSVPDANHHGTYESTGAEYEHRITSFFSKHLVEKHIP